MRCASCDKNLNDRESTRKSAVTGNYIDLCDPCYKTIADQLNVIESPNHAQVVETIEGEEYYD